MSSSAVGRTAVALVALASCARAAQVVHTSARRPLASSALSCARARGLAVAPLRRPAAVQPRAAAVRASSEGTASPEILRESRAFRRASWFSWWSQLILSVVSSITLVFANAARPPTTNALTSGLVLASAGVGAGFVSTFWMWGYKGFSKRLLRADLDENRLATKARRSLKLGILINLVGMGVTLLSAEQIIGVLASKALTQGLGGGYAAGGQLATGLANAVQPIDLLILQANTNTLLSLFCGLCTSLWLKQRKFVEAAPKN